MRKLILQEFITLDGLAAGPNDSVDFVPASTRGDRSFGQEQSALIDAIGTILLGRVTYRIVSWSRWAGWVSVNDPGQNLRDALPFRRDPGTR